MISTIKINFSEKYFENSVGFNAEMPKKNYYKICCSMDGSTTNCGDMEILTPYINMGVKRSKKRNILYTTPSKAEVITWPEA